GGSFRIWRWASCGQPGRESEKGGGTARASSGVADGSGGFFRKRGSAAVGGPVLQMSRRVGQAEGKVAADFARQYSSRGRKRTGRRSRQAGRQSPRSGDWLHRCLENAADGETAESRNRHADALGANGSTLAHQ